MSDLNTQTGQTQSQAQTQSFISTETPGADGKASVDTQTQKKSGLAKHEQVSTEVDVIEKADQTQQVVPGGATVRRHRGGGGGGACDVDSKNPTLTTPTAAATVSGGVASNTQPDPEDASTQTAVQAPAAGSVKGSVAAGGPASIAAPATANTAQNPLTIKRVLIGIDQAKPADGSDGTPSPAIIKYNVFFSGASVDFSTIMQMSEQDITKLVNQMTALMTKDEISALNQQLATSLAVQSQDHQMGEAQKTQAQEQAVGEIASGTASIAGGVGGLIRPTYSQQIGAIGSGAGSVMKGGMDMIAAGQSVKIADAQGQAQLDSTYGDQDKQFAGDISQSLQSQTQSLQSMIDSLIQALAANKQLISHFFKG